MTIQAGLELRCGRGELDRELDTTRAEWVRVRCFRAFNAAFCRFVPKCRICLSLILRFFGVVERGLRLTLRGLVALVASRFVLMRIAILVYPVS